MSDATSDPNAAPTPADPSGGEGFSRSVVDRRCGLDLRPKGSPERRKSGERRLPPAKDETGLKRLRGPGRRRPEFNRSAEEGEFTDEQFLFVMAVQAFKNANGKSFPTWTEVLEVIRRLGYRKTQPMELNLPNCEDWLEPADAPAMPANAPAAEDEVSDDAFDTIFDDDDE